MTRMLGCFSLVCTLAAEALAAPATDGKETRTQVAPASEIPPTFILALPAAVSLVAFLPVRDAREKDLFDLDLRVDVVLPKGCGDRLAGLLKRGGPVLDHGDAWDAILERRNAGECKKEPSRVGARWAIRMRVPDGATRDLTLGERVLKVSRTGAKILLDGEEATGDVPGAPATAAPATLLVGAVTSATVTSTSAIPTIPGAAVVAIDLAATWPKCAGAVIGLLARGEVASHFALDRFEPLAVAPLDGRCMAPLPKPRRSTVRVVLRVAKFTVGERALEVTLPPPAAAAVKR